MEKAKVYFTRDISPEGLMKVYEALSPELPGKVAIKVHSGETGNQNFLHPEFWKELIEKVNGTVTECNTAYEGTRNTTEKHLKTLEEHGWNKYFPVDLLDAEGPDLELQIPDGKVIKKNFVGKNIVNYDSLLFFPISKATPWAVMAAHLNSFQSALPLPSEKHISTERAFRKKSGLPITILSLNPWRMQLPPL